MPQIIKFVSQKSKILLSLISFEKFQLLHGKQSITPTEKLREAAVCGSLTAMGKSSRRTASNWLVGIFQFYVLQFESSSNKAE